VIKSIDISYTNYALIHNIVGYGVKSIMETETTPRFHISHNLSDNNPTLELF